MQLKSKCHYILSMTMQWCLKKKILINMWDYGNNRSYKSSCLTSKRVMVHLIYSITVDIAILKIRHKIALYHKCMLPKDYIRILPLAQGKMWIRKRRLCIYVSLTNMTLLLTAAGSITLMSNVNISIINLSRLSKHLYLAGLYVDERLQMESLFIDILTKISRGQQNVYQFIVIWWLQSK